MLSFILCFIYSQPPKGAVLCIIDGAGESSWTHGNALFSGRTPNLDYLKENYPYASLIAAQQSVGLLRNSPGSSAVGHQTIGLGRTTPSYYQYLERSLSCYSNTSLEKNEVLLGALKYAKQNNNRLHFFGQCTDAGVFAHTKFLKPMFNAAKKDEIGKVYVHCMMMGLTRSAESYLKDVEMMVPNGLNVKIGTIHSSDTSMDKNFDWDKTEVSFKALFKDKYANFTTREKAVKYIDSFNVPSPLFHPFILSKDSLLKDNDVLVMFNFREDKTYQIAKALMKGLDDEKKPPKNLRVVPMILYDKSFIDIPTLIPAIKYPNSLGSWISQKGYRQLRVAEKYKRPHVTTFFSGGILQPIFPLEDRIININSVQDHLADKFPEMNASLVTKTVINAIKSNKYKLIVVNFANIDATGHLGNVTAVKRAIEYVDMKIGEIIEQCKINDYALFVTADHGNGEDNIELDGSKQSDHTVNNVPFITNLKGYKIKQPKYGKSLYIGNIAATILTVLGIDIPPEMEPSILEKDFVLYNYKNNFIFCLFLSFMLGLFMMLLLIKLLKTRKKPIAFDHDNIL